MNNEDLLYHTGNYIKYTLINQNGKEYDKEFIYVCIYIKWSHFAIWQKLIQDCKSTIFNKNFLSKKKFDNYQTCK